MNMHVSFACKMKALNYNYAQLSMTWLSGQAIPWIIYMILLKSPVPIPKQINRILLATKLFSL